MDHVIVLINSIIILVLILLLLRLTRNRFEGFDAEKSHTAVVFELNRAAGFFSVFFMLCTAYIYAKKHNYDFYIQHSNWHYTYEKGWHDYIDSLTYWDPALKYDSVEYYKHASLGEIPDYTLDDYEIAVSEIFKPKYEIQNKVNEILATYPSKFNSLYIRRGDKIHGSIKEMDELSIQQIVSFTNLESSQNLYVQTDDYTVIETLQQLMPQTNILTLTTPDERGSSNLNLHNESPQKRYDETVKLLVQTMLFVRGLNCWSDWRSNVGRIHKVLAYDKVKFYPPKDNLEQIYSRDSKGNLAYER